MHAYDISVSDIAQALGVSKSTIKRRLREYGITIRVQQAIVTDTELDELVSGVQSQFPNAGYRRIYSQLRSRSIKVTQARVIESIHQTDPEGTAMRWLSITPRTVYSVAICGILMGITSSLGKVSCSICYFLEIKKIVKKAGSKVIE